MKQTSRLNRYGPAVVVALFIPALSLLPACYFQDIAVIPSLPGLDKLVHALMYAGLAGSLFHALTQTARKRYDWALRIALVAALYGLVMEVCQKLLTNSRSMDPLDALANLAGALVMTLLACTVSRVGLHASDTGRK